MKSKKCDRINAIGINTVGIESPIRTARLDLGYSQVELARRIGVHRMTLSFWERTLWPPSNKKHERKLVKLLKLQRWPECQLW